MIHLVAALGYDWAIKPIVAAGVNVNFRDIRGWTALHWAASCGRYSNIILLMLFLNLPFRNRLMVSLTF